MHEYLDPASLLFKITYSIVGSIVAGLVCGVFVMRRALKKLNNREFFDQVNFSLNIIQGNQLKLRTLIEKPASEVFNNEAMINLVNKACKKAKPGEPFLQIENPKDHWHCLNAALNELSEKFAEGFLRDDLNLNKRKVTYVIALTCEASDQIKTRKVRVMMIKQSLLEEFPEDELSVEFESHKTRIETLKYLSEAYTKDKEDYRFMHMEICV